MTLSINRTEQAAANCISCSLGGEARVCPTRVTVIKWLEVTAARRLRSPAEKTRHMYADMLKFGFNPAVRPETTVDIAYENEALAQTGRKGCTGPVTKPSWKVVLPVINVAINGPDRVFCGNPHVEEARVQASKLHPSVVAQLGTASVETSLKK